MCASAFSADLARRRELLNDPLVGIIFWKRWSCWERDDAWRATCRGAQGHGRAVGCAEQVEC